LAALVGPEGAANDFAQRLGAVDDEQAAEIAVAVTPRAYRLKASNAAPSFSTSAGTSANFLVGRFVDVGLTGQPAS
jgi:hypothetical protein